MLIFGAQSRLVCAAYCGQGSIDGAIPFVAHPSFIPHRAHCSPCMASTHNVGKQDALMADPRQLQRLQASVSDWNAWRDANPGESVNLSSADLRAASLGAADLRRAKLRRAKLHGADLRKANLSE